jgi:hypothetical protein
MKPPYKTPNLLPKVKEKIMSIIDSEDEDDLQESFDEIDSYMEDQDRERRNSKITGWILSGIIHGSVMLLLMAIIIYGNILDMDRPAVRPVEIPTPPEQQEEIEQRDVLEQDITIDSEITVETPLVNTLELEVQEMETEDEEVTEVAEARGREEAVSNSEMGGSGAFAMIGAGGGSAGAFGNRGSGRQRAVAQGGGTRASESAVEAALRWFARHQSPNGMWDVDGYPANCTLQPRCEPGRAHTNQEGDVACTGYVLLCFLGAGYDHRTPNRFRATVAAGIEYLITTYPDGNFSERNYAQGVCAMAMAEAYALSGDPRCREVAQRAIDILRDRQTPSMNGEDYGGLGWNYQGPSMTRNDSSISGWVIFGLKAGRAAGLEVGDSLDGARVWLESAWRATNPDWETLEQYDESGFPYTWNPTTNEISRPDRTPIGLGAAVFLGFDAGDVVLETMANDVMNNHLDNFRQYPMNTYYMYYSALGIFQVGGERWREFNQVMLDTLVPSQRNDDSCFDGSWDWEGTEFHGHDTGRLLSTAYNCLALEVYYRYVAEMR